MKTPLMTTPTGIDSSAGDERKRSDADSQYIQSQHLTGCNPKKTEWPATPSGSEQPALSMRGGES
jgi:hypothetical protein